MLTAGTPVCFSNMLVYLCNKLKKTQQTYNQSSTKNITGILSVVIIIFFFYSVKQLENDSKSRN